MTKKFLKTAFLTIMCIVLSAILAVAVFLFYMYFVYFGPHVSVNKLLKEISANPNVEKIEDYFQDDERYEEIGATIKLKNGLQMRFNYIRREDGKLVFQDLLEINGYVPMEYIYLKSENKCFFDSHCNRYLCPSHNLNEWLETSEAIYEKLQELPIT